MNSNNWYCIRAYCYFVCETLLVRWQTKIFSQEEKNTTERPNRKRQKENNNSTKVNSGALARAASSIGYDGIGAFSEIATKKLRQEIEPKNCDKK